MKRRLLVLAASVLLLTGGGAVATAGPARALNQFQFCAIGGESIALFPCANAWNGGANVSTYTPNASNEDFQVTYVTRNGTRYYELAYVHSDGVTVTCVGDTNNDPGNARASDNDACNGSNGYGGGWGTLFTLVQGSCVNGGAVWSNVHWNGWFNYSNYPSQQNGLAYYLNSGVSGYCMFGFTF